MSYFIDICFICLKHSNKLKLIKSQDTNGTSVKDELMYFLPEYEFNSNYPKYICVKCANKLNRGYEFKQKCLQNITTYEKYAQQITTRDGSYKCLSVFMLPNLVYVKQEIPESLNEIDINVVNIEEVIIKEEVLNDKLELSPQNIKEENFRSSDICEEIIIKKEANEKLVLDDKLESLLHEIKEESLKSDDMHNKNENIGENIQILDDCASFSTENENIREHQERYECNVCHKTYPTEIKLKIHISSHNIQQHKCRNCNKSFGNLEDVKKHELKYHEHKCKFCNKSFTRLYTLKQHKLVHTGEKPYTCEVCKESFRLSHHLKEHHLTHTNEKPYSCEICNKSFSRSSNLKQHRLIHTGENPFTCAVCNKSFRKSSDLNRHKLLHTGEKPFTCEVCNKSFRHSLTLNQHKLLHTGEKPFTCEVCNKSFRRLSTLKPHKFLHIAKEHNFAIHHSGN